jgi:hypothetical protein
MNLVAKVGVSAAFVGSLVFACSSTPAIAQAVVGSNVAPNPQKPGQCLGQGKFLYLPEAADVPGPNTDVPNTDDPDPKDMLVPNATGDVDVACSVIPSNNGFNVQLTTEISGGTEQATLTINGFFTPRARDSGGNPSADSTTIPNITVSMLDATKHLSENDCFAQYVLANGSNPATASLPPEADTFANDNGGRIWVSVFCPNETNLDEATKPGNAGCVSSMTFRFENCASKAQ